MKNNPEIAIWVGTEVYPVAGMAGTTKPSSWCFLGGGRSSTVFKVIGKRTNCDVQMMITKDEYFEWKLNWPDTCDDCGRREPMKRWRKARNPWQSAQMGLHNRYINDKIIGKIR